MSGAVTAEQRLRLRQAGPDELIELLRRAGGDLDPPALVQALRNPYFERQAADVLLALPGALAAYEVRREIAAHRHAPEAEARRLVAGLYTGDLARLAADPRVAPVIRRTAERWLLERLPALALGERIALARQAGGAVLAALGREGHPRVLAAMLDNPRLTEEILLPLVHHARTAPEALATIAADARWAVRREVRWALCRNPHTPPAAALELLSGLGRRELEAVSAAAALDGRVRRRAALLAGIATPEPDEPAAEV